MGTRGPKPGSNRNGGRQKGTRNRRTQAVITAVMETGISPLDYLLQVMRDPAGDAGVRLEAAKAAAPYVHPCRQSSTRRTRPIRWPLRSRPGRPSCRKSWTRSTGAVAVCQTPKGIECPCRDLRAQR